MFFSKEKGGSSRTDATSRCQPRATGRTTAHPLPTETYTAVVPSLLSLIEAASANVEHVWSSSHVQIQYAFNPPLRERGLIKEQEACLRSAGFVPQCSWTTKEGHGMCVYNSPQGQWTVGQFCHRLHVDRPLTFCRSSTVKTTLTSPGLDSPGHWSPTRRSSSADGVATGPQQHTRCSPSAVKPRITLGVGMQREGESGGRDGQIMAEQGKARQTWLRFSQGCDY